MTGEKNRFTTAEKLWNLDDKQLKSPVHDAMVLWLMDETNLKALLERQCENISEVIYTDKDYKSDEVYDVSINIQSEKPIMSSETFIAGYADLIVDFKYVKYTSKEKCPIDKKWYSKLKKVSYLEDTQLLLREYFNDENFEIKSFAHDDYTLREVHYNIVDGELKFTTSSSFDSKNGVILHKYPSDHTGKIDSFNVFADFWLNIFEDSSFDSDIMEWIQKGNRYIKTYYACNCLIEVKPYIDSFGAVLRQINSYKKFYKHIMWIDKEDSGYSRDYKFYTNFYIFTFDDRFDKQFESQGITVLHPWIGEKYMLQLYGFE